MANENFIITELDVQEALEKNIMQLDAMLNIAFNCPDLSLKDEKIRQNFLEACVEKIDAIRKNCILLFPSSKNELQYETETEKRND